MAEPKIALTPAERNRLTKGIAGRVDADIEIQAMRAVRRRDHRLRRDENLTKQAELRLAAVERRKAHRMKAAEYARDRRARA